MTSLSPLAQAVLRTLVYYDAFDYPLTVDQLWRWLYVGGWGVGNREWGAGDKDWTVVDIETALDSLELKDRVEKSRGFNYLRGRSAIIESRLIRQVENEKKWRRALSAARFLEIVPFVKLVMVVNTVAISNAKPDSDIDLLIVTAPGHIWVTRMMVTGIVSMLGYRRHGDKISNRICLSFYITTDALDLERLESTDDPDHHYTFWASQAVPLLDDGGYFERYMKANDWVRQRLPHAWQWDWKERLVPQTALQTLKRLYEAFFSSPIGAWIELWTRQRQLKKFDANTQSKAKEGTTDVVISEDVLKFHEGDRRREYNERFEKRLLELGL